MTTAHWYFGKDVEAISLVNIQSGEVLCPEEYFRDSISLDFSKINQIVTDGNGGLIFQGTEANNTHYLPDFGFMPIQTDKQFLPVFQGQRNKNDGIWGVEGEPDRSQTIRFSQITPDGQVLQSFLLAEYGELRLFFPNQIDDFWFIHTFEPKTPLFNQIQLITPCDFFLLKSLFLQIVLPGKTLLPWELTFLG